MVIKNKVLNTIIFFVSLSSKKDHTFQQQYGKELEPWQEGTVRTDGTNNKTSVSIKS